MDIKFHKKFKPSINFNIPQSMHVQQGKVKKYEHLQKAIGNQ